MKAGKNSIAKVTGVGSSLTLHNLLFVSFAFVGSRVQMVM